MHFEILIVISSTSKRHHDTKDSAYCISKGSEWIRKLNVVSEICLRTQRSSDQRANHPSTHSRGFIRVTILRIQESI